MSKDKWNARTGSVQHGEVAIPSVTRAWRLLFRVVHFSFCFFGSAGEYAGNRAPFFLDNYGVFHF